MVVSVASSQNRPAGSHDMGVKSVFTTLQGGVKPEPGTTESRSGSDHSYT